MSDEYQPNEVVESQSELEEMVMDVLPEPVPVAVEPEPAVDEISASSSVVEDVITPEDQRIPVEVSGETPVAVGLPDEPSIVSITDLEPSRPPLTEKLNTILTKAAGMFHGRGWMAVGIVAVLLIVFLFLPPISLAQRLSNGGGYAVLTADNPSVRHGDGLTVTMLSEKGRLRLKLETVPQAEFVAGNVPDVLVPALETLPAHLISKSPYYMLEFRGKERGPAMVEVDIPNDSEPWQTLDLYTWDVEVGVWRWVATQLDAEKMVLRAEVNALPSSVMVMQTSLVQQKISAEVDSFPLNGMEVVLTEADLTGMLIGTWGGLTGDATQLPLANQGGNVALVPVVRNWAPGRDPNWGLVKDMLASDADRQTHVNNLLGLAQSGGYSGIVLDYRAVQVANRDGYTGFVTALAQTLHENGIWLGVVVDRPLQVAGGTWDTGGYDWRGLGLAVDQFRVVMPLDPRDYNPGGYVEQLFAWAITQVDRYKLMPIFSTMSTDGAMTLALGDILAPVGAVTTTQPLTQSVTPGTALTFMLGKALNVGLDDKTGATVVLVEGQPRWLGTPQWLRARLDLVARYHMGGAVLRDLPNAGNMSNLMPTLADYQAQVPAATYTLPEVTWQVTAPDGKAIQATTPLSQPQFMWTALPLTGTYTVAANVAGLNKGSVQVPVAFAILTATGTLTDGITMTEGLETPPTSPLVAIEPGETYQATFVSDVTVPDNTQFEKKEAFVKTWRVKNSGSTTWPKSTVLTFSSGDQMTEAKQVAVGEVPAGETKDISVDMIAPDQDGTYKGVWWLYAGDAKIEGGGVTILVKVGEATPTPTPIPPTNPTGPTYPVSSGGFELGGHVRNMALPYQDKMHYAGMNWAKVQVHYAEDASWIVAAAHAAGFKIQLSALGGPAMVAEAGFEQKFAGWVAGLASAGADAIEVWNEPNIDREWQSGQISPQAYTNLLCAAYSAIKAANSGTAVISAAPAPTGYFGGCGATGCDDQPWMQGLYNAGAANCMDYIGAHHNSGATSPSARIGHPANTSDTHHSWFFLPQTELYYNIFGGSRKLFYTEMGYASQEGLSTFSDQFAWARGITNAQQAAWLAEAVQLGISTGMVRCIIVWNIDFVRYGYDPQDGYAIIRPSGECPACDSLHNVLGTR
ncbi:MAG: hypothetical protein JXA21_22945 [Anaerolineae bacterium]|nr:hypothetical protein [Anaerolineae bacterium]